MKAEVEKEERDLTKKRSPEKCELKVPRELLEGTNPLTWQLDDRYEHNRDVSEAVIVNDLCTLRRSHFKEDRITGISQSKQIHENNAFAEVALQLLGLFLRQKIIIMQVRNRVKPKTRLRYV